MSQSGDRDIQPNRPARPSLALNSSSSSISTSGPHGPSPLSTSLHPSRNGTNTDNTRSPRHSGRTNPTSHGSSVNDEPSSHTQSFGDGPNRRTKSQVISLSSHSDRRDTLASSILHRPSLSPSQSKAYLEIEGMLGLGPGRLALADRGTATRASASALSHFPTLQDSKSSTITANQDPAPWVVRAKRDSPPVSVPQTPRMSVATTSTESSFAQSLFYIPKKQQNRLSTASTMAHHNFTEFAEDALEPLDQAEAGDALSLEGSPDTPTSIPMHVGSERLRAARSETELRPRRCRHNRLQRTSTSTSSTETSPNAGDISLSLLSQRISQVTTTTDLMASGLDDPFSADPAEIPPVPPLPPHLVSPKTSEFAIVAHPEVASAPATPLSPTGTASSTAGSSTFTQITHTHTHRVVLPVGVSSVTVQIAPGTTVEVNFEQGSGSTKPKQQPFLKKWKSKIFNKKDGDIV